MRGPAHASLLGRGSLQIHRLRNAPACRGVFAGSVLTSPFANRGLGGAAGTGLVHPVDPVDILAIGTFALLCARRKLDNVMVRTVRLSDFFCSSDVGLR